MNVRELREALAGLPDGLPVLVWLPGSRIELGSVITGNGSVRVLIEGNVVEGSALDAAAD